MNLLNGRRVRYYRGNDGNQGAGRRGVLLQGLLKPRVRGRVKVAAHLGGQAKAANYKAKICKVVNLQSRDLQGSTYSVRRKPYRELGSKWHRVEGGVSCGATL